MILRLLSLLNGWFPYVAGVTLAMAIAAAIWLKGYHACANEHMKAAVKEETAYAKIEQKNMRLSDTELDRALCAHWMRRPCPKT